VCFRWERGDAAAAARAFAAAAHVTSLDLVNNRLVGAAIEPRAVLAVADPATGRLTVYDSTQTPHHVRRFLAEELGLAESDLRVIAPDVGGGFGYKGKHYPEETIVAWAARRLRRPIKWVATRAESFLADNQARDHRTRAALALDRDGKFLALRVETLANLGDLQFAPCRALSHARDPREGHRRLHQHAADRCLSRRRAAGSLLRAGAARRSRRARDGHRSGGNPPAQSHPRRGHAVQDAHRADLRRRRFPARV
jgi:CO/xanthine dehydrogenase Mo-binding subunit